MNKKTESLIENVSAISATFHTDERYQKFYDEHGANLGGFSGIWNYVGRAAEAFTIVETELLKRSQHFWNDHDYVDTVDSFTDALFKSSDLHTARQFVKLARGVFREVK